MGNRVIIAFALVVVALGGCNKSRCWKSWGNDSGGSVNVEPWHTLEVNDHMHIRLFQPTGDLNYVDIAAGTNMLDHIRIEVENGVLIVSDDNTCDWLRDYDKEITLTIPVNRSFRGIRHNGTGNIHSTNTLTPDTLNINLWNAGGNVNVRVAAHTVRSKIHAGQGDITVKGTARLHEVYATGPGYIHADSLASNTVWATQLGVGDMAVWATDELTVELTSSGSLFYRGQPNISAQEITGSGQVVPL